MGQLAGRRGRGRPDPAEAGRSMRPVRVALPLLVLAVALAVVAPGGVGTAALGPKTLVQLGAGGSVSCGLTTDNTIICWGRNSKGELGDGTGVDSPIPVAVKTVGTPLAG